MGFFVVDLEDDFVVVNCFLGIFVVVGCFFFFWVFGVVKKDDMVGNFGCVVVVLVVFFY